jgi:hypothetical protein
MFTYTNTVVINSDTDELSGLVKFEGKNNQFRVKRVGRFDKDSVKYVTKRAGYKGIISTATFTPPTAPTTAGAEDFYRIELFMRLSGSQASTMATAATVYKSKPIHIEFKVAHGDSASTIADNMVKAVRFYQQNLYPYIKASKDGSNKVIISGTDEYEVFNKAELQQLVSATVSVYPDDQNQYKKVSEAVIANGKEGFGTYTYIMKNLRLPTLEALRFASPTQDEMPVMGMLYNQYTLEYCKDRGIMGSDAVGDTVTSITHHVFFVRQDLSSAFEAAITAAGLSLKTITNEDDPEAPKIVLTVPAGQTVEQGGTVALKFAVDGAEKTSGGTWSIVGSVTGASITGNSLKTTKSTPTGNITVKVAYEGEEAQGTVNVTEKVQ